MSSITNAIQYQQVVDRISQSAEICHRYHKSFSLMVSLDGIGELHDTIRGRKGNFETAFKVLQYFQKKQGVQLLTGTTITKDNVWHVDEIVDFLQRESLYG